MLAGADGVELCSYEKMWLLPRRVMIDPHGAWRSHQISNAELKAKGVAPLSELRLLVILFDACLAKDIVIVMHKKSFDVPKLNATADFNQLGRKVLNAEQAFCSMLNSRDICRVQKKGSAPGVYKEPGNAELFKHFFDSLPEGRLHRALADARVTLASYAQAVKLRCWLGRKRQRTLL